jgi:hypothetical protein
VDAALKAPCPAPPRRYWKAQDVCAITEPQLVLRAVEPHPSACHFAELSERQLA